MDWWFRYGSAQNVPRYDCRVRNLTAEEWAEDGVVSYVIGIPFILYGVLAEIIYVLVMMVMLRPELLRMSCYKIMLVLGIYDMLAIGVNSILTGYLWMIGGNYCTHPDLIYVSGAIGLGLWCGACMNCFVLVLNRLIDLWKPHLMDTIFGGHRTFLILMLPLLYSLYFILFTEPLLFSSKMTAWFFDPFINNSGEGESFFNIPHTANNLLIVVSTCVLYAFLCYVLVNKFKSDVNTKISWAQKSVLIQSTAICMANLVAALIYVYMQFFATPHWLILIGHMSWQAGHGMPAFVYLLLNKTIRAEVMIKLGLKRAGKSSNSIHTTTNFHI